MTTGILAMNGYSGIPEAINSAYAADRIESTYKKRAIKRELMDAISHDEFELVYQPQTEISGHQVVGVEALLRWNSPKEGIISPEKFIPAAEESGLILELGDMVIDKACAQAEKWKKQYHSNIRIAVNMSYMQVHSIKIVEYVESCISKYNIEHNLLEIELTESSLIREKDKVIKILHQFKEMGVRTAMDDFGTGYSSLSYLANMPFDMIKIDKSFINGLGKNVANTIITESIIEMGKKLNMQVLAEGVETEEQRNILNRHQCDLLQGNLISRPVTAEKLPEIAGMKTC